MKTKLNFKRLITNLLVVVFVLTVSFELTAQTKKSNNLKNFKIVVEKTDDGIKMHSDEGSAWVDLSFSINNEQPQAINEFGMTELDKSTYKEDTNLVNYLITITKTENGILLKGIKGTAWTDLSFTLNKNSKQAIDQFGITTLD